MMGLDTNVLLRYLLQDDPVQTRKVNRLFERELSGRNPGHISLATTLEIVWVLSSVFRLTPTEISGALRELLSHEALLFQNEPEVVVAVYALRRGTGEFEDALIGALNAWAGCSTTLTFDRKAARIARFRLMV
jgi:predicted nucleic-acid-binding protein